MSAFKTIQAGYAAFGRKKNGGTPLDSPFCHVFRFHGDKIVMFQQFTDTAQWTRLMT